MLASVFQLDMLLAARRQRPYALRWIYAGLLLVLLVPWLLSDVSLARWIATGGYNAFFERLVVLHFGLLFLLTPALVGSAITEEKVAGTLQHLLTAPLRPIEIVLGKLAARTLQLGLLAMAGLPLIALFSGIGGDATFAPAVLLVSLACIFGLAGISILASACCRQTRDAMLTVYLGGLCVLAVGASGLWPRLGRALDRLDPVRAVAFDDQAHRWRHLGPCVLGWLGAGCIGALGAGLCLRRAYLRQLRAVSRTRPRWWTARQPVGADPVLWRERSLEGIAPLPSLRAFPRWLGVFAVLVASAGSLGWFLSQHLAPGASMVALLREGRLGDLAAALRPAPGIDDVFYWHGLAMLVGASLLVAIRASGCISAEREQSTWEAVLLTPLTIRKIVRGKHWGIMLACLPYLATYAAAALTWGLLLGAGGAIAWTLLWLVGAVFAVQYAGAVGVWRSAAARSSWRSLTATLAWCYLTWVLLAMPLMLLVGIVHFVVTMLLFLAGVPEGVTTMLQLEWHRPGWALALSLIPAGWLLCSGLLAAAVRAIALRDRAKDIDPQFQHLYDRWLEKIEDKRRRPPPPLPDELEEPLALQD